MKIKILIAFFIPALSFAQNTSTYIRLPGTVGFVIDSAENRQAHLIKFIPEKQFNCGALMQLADSNIVLRVMLSDGKGMRNIYYSKAKAEKFIDDLRLRTVYVKIPSDTDEAKLIAQLADSGTIINTKTKDQLYEKHRVEVQESESVLNDSLETKEENFVAVNVGIGSGYMDVRLGGLATGVKVQMRHKRFSGGIRYYGIKQFSLFGTNDEYSRDLSLLAGANYLNDYLLVSVMSGITYAIHQRHGKLISVGFLSSEYQIISTNTIGVPLDLHLDFFPHNSFGIGVNFFTSINKTFYWGGMFTLRVGRLLPQIRRK